MAEKENLTDEPLKQSAADYEYNTLMRLLGVSVSKHLIDEHFTLIWANDFFYELLGWPKEEYEARFHNHPDLYFSGDDKMEWDRLVEAVTEALTTHQNGYSLVSRLRRKNGEYIWVKYTATFSEEYVNGTQVSYTVITNIDDLIRMQKEQSVTYNNLPGFVAKFRIEDDWFQLLDANDRFRNFFNCQEKEGLSYGLSNIQTDRNKITLEQNLPRMKKGQPVHFTVQAKDQAGGNVWLQVNADCIEWANGIPLYLVIYIDITDITEQRELQKQLEERSKMLRDALEAAKQANKAKSEFLSRMSHDIRTPMNAIMGMRAIASANIENKERVLDCLNKIDVSSKLLLSLINEVLDMSKIESGRIAMEVQEFSISDVLKNIVAIIQPSIMEKKHSFDIHAYELRHELVIGDPQRIEQVFLNILSNAIKYTPDHGKIVLDIRELPSLKEGYGYYEFVFKDNGYGMKEEFLDKLFTPFERARDADIYSIQGTGLGMAISKNIVQMMNGSIDVASTYEKGSVFTVRFYLKLQDEEVTEIRLPSDAFVLVVDDDPAVCENTCMRLAELGLRGKTAMNGKEAVQAVMEAHSSGNDFLFIILDLEMPGMNGIETARQIRNTAGPELPIVLLSAYDCTEYETSAALAGVNSFLTKPMLKSSLIYAIRRYVLKEPAVLKAEKRTQIQRSYVGKQLMLVEDNELNQEIAAEILKQTGAAITLAANGKEAVEKFTDAPVGYFDLIFMDIQMPVMGGIEATRRIRSLNRRDAKTVPVIAMTANVFAEDIAQAKAAGMNAHLAKPLDIVLIGQMLDKYIPL